MTNDEFSPVYYNNGIVFCSNLKNNSPVTYHNEQKKLFNIFFCAAKDSIKWENAKILAKELTTNYNDGPVTFNENGNMIYYCRNNDIKVVIKTISDTTNRLGIYSAELIEGKWTNIQPFTHNNSSYSLLTPALTHNGKRIYFASDMPGGYGGTDLYYCDWNEKDWTKPVNLGPVINTPGNESFPFVSKSEKLFFASDGHIGFGGKDIYYSQEIDGRWINPIHLDADINSPTDDFGLVADENFESGFFSSNRRKTDDIFHFTSDPIQFINCDTMVKINYCYIFFEKHKDDIDAFPVRYEWDFGNGIKKIGVEVNYCFPGPGEYEVKLNVIDLRADTLLGKTSYKLELLEVNQVYIDSPDAGIVDSTISFNGLKTNLPDFTICDYVWDFGEGFTIRGPSVSKIFDKKGEYTAKLGLLGEKDSLGNITKVCAYKKISIFDDYQEWAMQTARELGELGKFYPIERQIQPGSESSKLINTKSDSEEVKKSNSLTVRIYFLDNLSELQKYKIFEKLCEISDCEIEWNDSGIEPASYPILIKFINILKENPDIKLEVAVHTNDKRFSGSNLEISEKCARDLYSYFINYGITPKKLHCKGYGKSRLIASETPEYDNNLSGSVEFILINNPD
ncbi:hypothetical protein AC481_07265 [miscellaneous Crenarchaeota group archaeon SMTZ-80]|nr:MAG: hypothetical protein AC481_07265 [miscellaneous Crenarchaeota group archaeon SMTZ-80]